MQCCQHCGAKSWAQATSDQLMGVAAEVASGFVICDGCGQWGIKSVIDAEPQAIEFPEPRLLSASPLAQVGDMFKSMMPVTETRLERLVKAFLQGWRPKVHGKTPARDIVDFCREMETELDRVELLDKAPAPDADFGVGEGA